MVYKIIYIYIYILIILLLLLLLLSDLSVYTRLLVDVELTEIITLYIIIMSIKQAAGDYHE